MPPIKSDAQGERPVDCAANRNMRQAATNARVEGAPQRHGFPLWPQPAQTFRVVRCYVRGPGASEFPRIGGRPLELGIADRCDATLAKRLRFEGGEDFELVQSPASIVEIRAGAST
jgi:hypothetical protein